MKPTSEQATIIESGAERLYIEAEPGSGKTQVAAARFGAQRFRVTTDQRAILALSFTRSATQELRARIRLLWGPRSVAWPHGVTTIDSLVGRLVEHLLHSGKISWPGGHRSIDVVDSWKGELHVLKRDIEPRCGLRERTVVVLRLRNRGPHPRPGAVEECVADGRCTHTDMRQILTDALLDLELRDEIVAYFRATTRALIVDEIFDGNSLDLELVSCAAEAGNEVSLVGDPWQALYEFRGAKPRRVAAFVAGDEFKKLPLTASRRWRTEEQAELAQALRSCQKVKLTSVTEAVDVVIAKRWEDLWQAGPPVLPIAFRALSNDSREAALCVLLDAATRMHLGLSAAAIGDALFALRLDRIQELALRGPLEQAIERLRPGQGGPAYEALSAAMHPHGISLGPARSQDLADIEKLATRLSAADRPIPGLTAHHAKGQEWDRVGVVLGTQDVEALERGLSVDAANDRTLYVACTRARYSTERWTSD